jgi:tetraacyldisaccharide 4'-kinase
LRVAVVTRGYKRDTRGFFPVSDGAGVIAEARSGGDEPVQIARKFPRAVVIADETRIRGCRRARESYGAEVILLDDGYQHRACARDLDIVVMDATQPLREQRLLPAGRLREPLKNLSRADLVILSKCEPQRRYDQLAQTVSAYASAPVIVSRFVPERLRLFRGGTLETDAYRGKTAFLVCGIGAPESFLRTAEMLGLDVADRMEFPDHHAYSAADIAVITARFHASRAALLLTTEKDAVRFEAHRALLEPLPILYPEMAVHILSGEEDLRRLLDGILTKRVTPTTGGTP